MMVPATEPIVAGRDEPRSTMAATPLAVLRARPRAAVLTRDNLSPHAGGKAPSDVRDICARMGLETIGLPAIPARRFSLANAWRFGLGTLTLMARTLLRKGPEALIIQHPIVGRLEKRLILRLFRRSKKIAVIHDLDVLRKPTGHFYDDLHFLSQCDVLIAHNDSMRAFLIEELPRAQVLVLGIFDYLVPPASRVPPPAARPARIFVIGNLHPMKASYLYRLGSIETPVAAYGPNCTVESLPPSVTWMGIAGPEGPPLERIDGFGLVWDGDSPDGLAGGWGEYLKFNAPHKLSLYVVLGLPVIVHRGSAMADLVRATGIGFETDSIEDAARRVAACSGTAWQSYCDAVLRLREKITDGLHTTRALDTALSMVGVSRRADRTHP